MLVVTARCGWLKTRVGCPSDLLWPGIFWVTRSSRTEIIAQKLVVTIGRLELVSAIVCCITRFLFALPVLE